MIGPDESSPLRPQEKDFVAEQPGWMVLAVGLFLAFIVGISFRSAFTPLRVRELVAKAAAQIHPDVQVHFDSAFVSLADGIFPELSVVITNVSLGSNQSCWLAPSVEINQIKLPLSISHLLQGQIYIHEVEADEVTLSLRSAYKSCVERGASVDALSSSFRNVAQETSAAVDLEKGGIDTVRVRHVRVYYLPVAFTSFEISDLSVLLRSRKPQVLSIEGRVHFGGETLSGDYSSHSRFEVNYNENKSQHWSVKAFGLWREGHYDLAADFDPHLQSFTSHFELKHIPLSQVFPLLKKYKLMSADWNGRQTWLSVSGQVEGVANDIDHVVTRLEDIKLEGDLGEIEASPFLVRSLSPLKMDDIELKIRSLDINKLITFLNRSHPGPTLGHLGVFQGTAWMKSQGEILLRGEHSGLELIFSNRGLREKQTISLVAGEVHFKNKMWTLKVDRMKPAEGLFIGEFQMVADAKWNKVQMKAKIEDLNFSPAIQKLMTNGGSMDSLSGQVASSFENGKVDQLSGAIKSNEMIIDNVKLRRVKVSVRTRLQEVFMEASVQNLILEPDSVAYHLMSPIVAALKLDGRSLAIDGFSSQVRTRNLSDFSWKNLKGHAGSQWIHSDGGWNEEGQLSGGIEARGAGESHRWQISGNRDHPQFQLR